MREPDAELDLGDYLSLLRRRWRFIALTTLVLAGLVTAFTVTREEVYGSRSEVLILTDTSRGFFSVSDEVHEELKRQPFAEREFLTDQQYRRFARQTSGIADPDIEYTLLSLPDQESAETFIISFAANGSTPDEAADIVNSYADAYIELRHQLDLESSTNSLADATARRSELLDDRDEAEAPLDQLRTDLNRALNIDGDLLAAAQIQAEIDQTEDDLAATLSVLNAQISGVQARIVVLGQTIAELDDPTSAARIRNEGFTPKNPISPDVPRNIIFGIIAGLVLGLAAAIARDLLDTRARDGAEIAQLVDVPVIAAIGQLPSQRSAPGGVRRFSDLTDADASGYRVLLNSLWLSTIDGPLQSIAFTSDRPDVGKTQTVVNLAQAEAARGTNVLIIDTDFVNPSVADRLELERSGVGLGDLLSGAVDVSRAISKTGIDNLDFIDAFSEDEHAGDLLRSDKLRLLLTDLYSHYDLIILDSPPTLSTADSRLVASQADAAVVAYDPSVSRIDELQRAIELLRSARVNLIGLVANRSRASHPVYMSARER